jgi:hypothetical protein
MPEPPSPTIGRDFLSVLPRMSAVVRFHLRPVRCPHRREEMTCEAVALCWVWFVRLARRGRQPHAFATRLATYAARAARSGRRACGSEPVADVCSPACGRRKGVRLASLSAPGPADDSLAEAVHDNTRTPVPDQVQFRLDFPAWVSSLATAKRRVLDRLLAGDRPGDVAAAVGVSAARVSQLRAELRADYARFCGDRG